MTEPKKDRRLHLSTSLTVQFCIAASVIALLLSYAYFVGEREKLIEMNASTEVFRNFNVEQLDGSTYTSDQLKQSKLTVLNVWETTCPSCIGEFPDLPVCIRTAYGIQCILRPSGLRVDVPVRTGTGPAL